MRVGAAAAAGGLYEYPLFDVAGLSNTTPRFREQLVSGSMAHGYNPDYIATLISVESGFNPKAASNSSSARGLLQWLSSTFPAVAARARMNITHAEVTSLSATEQLPLVFAYLDGTVLKSLGDKATVGDYYMAVFMPAYVGKEADFIVGQKNAMGPTPSGQSLAAVYAANPGLDRNQDGKITVWDVETTARLAYQEAAGKPRVAVRIVPYDPFADSGASQRYLYLALAGAGAFLVWRWYK